MKYFICVIWLAAVVGCGQANQSPLPKTKKLTDAERRAFLVEQLSSPVSMKPVMLLHLEQQMKDARESIHAMREGLQKSRQTVLDREAAEDDLEFANAYYKFLEDKHSVIRKCKDPQDKSTQRELLSSEIELQKARIRHLESQQARDSTAQLPISANRIVLENLEARLKDEPD